MATGPYRIARRERPDTVTPCVEDEDEDVEQGDRLTARAAPPAAPKLTLWTPGHLDGLHDALLQGTPLRAQLTALPEAEVVAGADTRRGRQRPAATAKLSLWVPRGQEQDAAEAASEWQDESAMVVREAAQDDGDLEDDAVPMSTSWLRDNGLAAPSRIARAATTSSPAGSRVVPRALGHFRRKRAASPGPNEASSEDASVAADSSQKVPPPLQQAKAARGHQFITGRNEKEPPPVVREVEVPSSSSGTSGVQRPGQQDAKQDARSPPPPPTHSSPVQSGSSRVGAGRDALGLRVNEIPQGPRYSSVYEGETLRHAADHRHYTADSYGSLNAYSSNYAGSYGSSSNLAASYPPPQPPPPAHPRSAPTATPRRIIYYASLPDPVPQPNLQQYQPQHLPLPQQLPGSSRVPHEYRGPPYDVNGAYSSDARYPPPPGDNPYRYTIIDAEPPGPVLGGYRSNALPYRDRLPGAGPAPAAYPQPYRINPPLQAAPPSPTPDAGPQAASPIQYTQYDYNGIGARTATASALLDSKQGLPLPPGPPLSDDPYRGFNPRQPAPWSMQVGTRLTVKDDGYGGGSAGGGLPPAARRFYVTSQQQPGYGDALYGPQPARFPRPLDRPGALQGLQAGSEARNRLYR
ncbi:extensin-like [Thrips palmi]|uniref:Extensin-like n=1 Tax=Thrips palmi TaxID=161013 RepID=A0A6P8Y257_THRPL|nr:extensin-like [Thrips palmi]